MLLSYGQARLNEFATIFKTYIRSVFWIAAPLHNGKENKISNLNHRNRFFALLRFTQDYPLEFSRQTKPRNPATPTTETRSGNRRNDRIS